MAKKKDGIASVLAFEKKIVFSDGYMYGTTWENRYDDKEMPIPLVEKSVRGTISHRLPDSVTGDPVKLSAEVEKANLQTVDSATLDIKQDTLKLKFTVKVLPNPHIPSACNDETHLKNIESMGKKFIQENGFQELAKRYAINLANARFLWRNRVGAEALETVITMKGADKTWTFDSYKLPLKNFEVENSDVKELSEIIANTLTETEKRKTLLLEVTAFAKVGNGQEVYPSEELILDKNKNKNNGEKSKVLYSVNNIAAMHSQKIGNAVRTIDTWYPHYDELPDGPIAIEVYGSVTNLGRAFRGNKADKKDFYTLFDKWSSNTDKDLIDENDKNYVMAVLVRGGVFGTKEKE